MIIDVTKWAGIQYADLKYHGISNETNEDELASIVINLSGTQMLIHEEKEVYPLVGTVIINITTTTGKFSFNSFPTLEAQLD